MVKNILLTGSGGFIGTHLKNYLSAYFTLFTPRSFELNLLDKNAIKKFANDNKIDFIVHCASCGVRTTFDANENDITKPNIEMFNNLAILELPIITIGSGAEYDKSRPLHKVKETDFGKFVPNDPYGYSKYLISKEIENKKNILNLRLFGIYGYGENSSRVASCAINNNLSHKPIILNQNAVFDFIWIDDFCKILKFFIENPSCEKFINVTPKDSIEIIELAKIVNKFSNYKSEIIVKKQGLNKEYTGDNTLLLNLIPDFKFTPYETGLEKMYRLMSQKN